MITSFILSTYISSQFICINFCVVFLSFHVRNSSFALCHFYCSLLIILYFSLIQRYECYTIKLHNEDWKLSPSSPCSFTITKDCHWFIFISSGSSSSRLVNTDAPNSSSKSGSLCCFTSVVQGHPLLTLSLLCARHICWTGNLELGLHCFFVYCPCVHFMGIPHLFGFSCN